MSSIKSPRVLWSGIVLITIGLLRLFNEWLGIPRGQMRDAFVRGLPYLWPILVIVCGSTLVVMYVNKDD